MSITIKASTAADFLALIPTLTGHNPKGNLLTIPFSGTRTVGAIRLDLPQSRTEAQFGPSLVGILARIELVDSVVIAAYPEYTDHPRLDAFIDELKATLDQAGYAVKDALVIDPEHYHSRMDERHEPHPVSEITDAAERLGYSMAKPAYGTDQPLDVGRLSIPHIRALMRQMDSGLAMWEEYFEEALLAVHAGTHTNLDVARIGMGLTRLPQRDQILPGIVRGRVHDELGADMELLVGDTTEIPEYPVLRRGHTVMRVLAEASETDEEESMAIAHVGWFDWASGLGTAAHRSFVRACAIDPQNTLAGLLDRFIGTGVMPSWAYAAADRNAR